MNRDFKGVWIPKEIYLRTDIEPFDKILLSEVDSLSKTEIGCIAGDDYLCQFMQCNRDKLQRSLRRLKKLGLIETVSFDGRTREMRVCYCESATAAIANSKQSKEDTTTAIANSQQQEQQIRNSSHGENATYINTAINPVINTTINKRGGDCVLIHDYPYRANEWRISAMLLSQWDDIRWDAIHPDSVPFILDFFRWRRDIKKKPVLTAEMANGILNDIRGRGPKETEALVYKAKNSGGGWLRLVYDNKKDKTNKSVDAIRNMRD